MVNTDNLTGSQIFVKLAHERTHAGRMFQTSYKSPEGVEIADDGTIEILFKNGAIPVHFTFSATAGGNMEISLFESVTTTGNGSALDVVAMNRRRSVAPQETVFLSPTISADGNQLFNGFDSRGVGLSAPEARQDTEWILNINTDYLIRLTNRAGGARDMAIVIQWYHALN